MHPETINRVAVTRLRVSDAKKELERIRTALGGSEDAYIDGLVQQAEFWLDDVEDIFIAMLEEKRSPPRTLGQELSIIYAMDMHLNTVTMPLVRSITDMFKTFGPNIKSIGD